jgi:hypothetical protein
MYLLRKARPQTRYAVACGAMLLCAALPLSSILMQLADARAVAAAPAAAAFRRWRLRCVLRAGARCARHHR